MFVRNTYSHCQHFALNGGGGTTSGTCVLFTGKIIGAQVRFCGIKNNDDHHPSANALSLTFPLPGIMIIDGAT